MVTLADDALVAVELAAEGLLTACEEEEHGCDFVGKEKDLCVFASGSGLSGDSHEGTRCVAIRETGWIRRDR